MDADEDIARQVLFGWVQITPSIAVNVQFPADGSAGYAKGCVFSCGDTVYANKGDQVASKFRQVYPEPVYPDEADRDDVQPDIVIEDKP